MYGIWGRFRFRNNYKTPHILAPITCRKRRAAVLLANAARFARLGAIMGVILIVTDLIIIFKLISVLCHRFDLGRVLHLIS